MADRDETTLRPKTLRPSRSRQWHFGRQIKRGFTRRGTGTVVCSGRERTSRVPLRQISVGATGRLGMGGRDLSAPWDTPREISHLERHLWGPVPQMNVDVSLNPGWVSKVRDVPTASPVVDRGKESFSVIRGYSTGRRYSSMYYLRILGFSPFSTKEVYLNM